MLASKRKVIIVNSKNWGIFCQTMGTAFYWESLASLDRDALGRCTTETRVKCEREDTVHGGLCHQGTGSWNTPQTSLKVFLPLFWITAAG